MNKPKEKTEFDYERIRKAQEKRERKAAKRVLDMGGSLSDARGETL